jgi:hypothetical protein
MRKLLLCTILLATVAAGAQPGPGGAVSGPVDRPRRVTFADLGAPIAGNFRYCLDCLPTSPCTAGGTGAFAYRVGAAWNCNVGSAGTGDVAGPTSSTDTAIAIYDGTTGKLLKNSTVTIDASGNVAVAATAQLQFGGIGSTNYLSYVDTIGPRWSDDTTGLRITHNVQSLGAHRTVTWPDASGTVAFTSSNVATATALAANPTDCSVGQFATTIAASGNLTCAVVAAASNLIVSTGVGNGTGMQHTRAASCTTGALINASCDTTITWPVAFADTNYTAVATLDSPAGGLVFILSTKNKTATTIDVTLVTLTAAASSGTINLIGMHD